MGSIWINDLIRLRDSSIIFSTFWGLYRITKEGNEFVANPFSELNKENFLGFRRLFQDEEGFVYVKSTSENLYILKPGLRRGDYELVKKISFPSDIHHFFYDKEKKITLIGTAGGLYTFSTNDYKLEKSDVNNRLPFSTVSSVFRKDDHLWIFGEKGLYVFDEKNNSGKTFTIEDGLPSNEFSLSTLTFGPGQKCIAGTSNGIVSFFPDEQPKSGLLPGIQLTGIYVNDVIHASSPNANEIGKISLSSKENTFSFDFSAIAFQHLTDYRFEYQLEGYDEGWIKSLNGRYTRYSKIPPGDYTFKLRVIDPQGNISPTNKSLAIYIAPAFYQTLSFKIVAGALLLALGWLAVKWYFNQKIKKQKLEFEKLQAIEKERTRIATDMHDDLGAGLSRIKFLSQSLSNKDTSDRSIKTALEKITGYSDEMTEKMGEIVWALNEKNDTLADLVAYTRSYAMEYLANHNIQCQADTPLHLPGSFIPGEVRRNIFLTVKECLHNIVKHANATSVYFSVQLNGAIEIVIHDNGKGIDWGNRRPNGNGLENIQKRMNEIKGKADFSNKQGTEVKLSVPLNL
jgi:signal transduction histidine kinase